MSSHVFLGPTPISENSCVPPFKLATALLETAAGMEGILDPSAPNKTTAQIAGRRAKHNFFIAEILRPHGEGGQNTSLRRRPSVFLLDQSLPHPVNKVRVGGCLAAL